MNKFGSEHSSIVDNADPEDKQFKLSPPDTEGHIKEKAKDAYVKDVAHDSRQENYHHVFVKATDMNSRHRDKMVLEMQSPLKVPKNKQESEEYSDTRGIKVSTSPKPVGLKSYESNEALQLAKNELSLNRRRTSVLTSKLQGSPNQRKMHKASIAEISQDFIQNNDKLIKGIDPKYYDDYKNYKPNLDYNVTLNFKKEFIRHKRIMCSIKEFKDIQTKWDVGYCKTFCQHGNNSGLGQNGVADAARDPRDLGLNPQKQTEAEQEVAQSNNSYFENYRLDDDLKKSVGKIVLAQQDSENNQFLNKESTKFNTHTKELMEGYILNPGAKNDAGIGLTDFADKMVLRFKNEHELGLYFDAVDQLSNVVILKG